MLDRIRLSTYRIMNPATEPSRGGRIFEFFILSLILLNVIAVVAETIQEVELRYRSFLWGFEVFSVAVFTVEYVLRLLVCSESDGRDDGRKGQRRGSKTQWHATFVLPLIQVRDAIMQ